MSEVKNDMCLLVSFQINSKKGTSSKSTYKFYIGKIIKCDVDSDEFEGTFLRNINSKDHLGYIYGFPNDMDEFTFSFHQL